MKIITSESVFKGHPDKVCDQISDAILDECLKQDKNSRVAIECLLKDELLIVAGEVTTSANINYSKTALNKLKELGLAGEFKVIEKVSKQSDDIALGVDKEGAGDQGIMYGYATFETVERMPLPIVLARKIAIKMDELSAQYPDVFGRDGKCQVSVEYDDNDIPVRVSNIIVSQQTQPWSERSFYYDFIMKECITKVIPQDLLTDTQILINPTGEFVKGGSFADCGLTGRKIICDTYGGVGRHGGGAFSGKDATKVDRIGAYYARYVAKNIVEAGIAGKCEIQVAYSIGVSRPIAINVDTFSTSDYSNDLIRKLILKVFDFSTTNIKKVLCSENIKYQELASYGHVGRSDINVPWEKTDKVNELLNELNNEQETRFN